MQPGSTQQGSTRAQHTSIAWQPDPFSLYPRTVAQLINNTYTHGIMIEIITNSFTKHHIFLKTIVLGQIISPQGKIVRTKHYSLKCPRTSIHADLTGDATQHQLSSNSGDIWKCQGPG